MDLDNDGWLDLFMATYRQGNCFVLNGEGDFSSAALRRLSDVGAVVAAGAAFGDVDRDGDLDIGLGNWSLGYLFDAVPGTPASSRDFLLLQEDGEFAVHHLDELPGETQSTLLTDMNGDGALDLIVGNDFGSSDAYYYGDGTGRFAKILASSGEITHTTWSTMSVASADMFAEHSVLDESDLIESIPELGSNNVLLVRRQDGTFADRAKEKGLNVTGWTWNAKFADLDNDEWQDIYVANGHFPSRRRESNFFFHNLGGEKFVDHTDRFGLDDRRATGAYTYVDFDGDCDLDIVSVPIRGSVRVFRNDTSGGNCLMLELRDAHGNRFGIGSKITVRYGPDGARHQMREIQAGGGFLSFDAPIAHFGLGEFEAVESIEIVWSTGGTTHLEGPFVAETLYRVTRNAAAAPSSTSLRGGESRASESHVASRP